MTQKIYFIIPIFYGLLFVNASLQASVYPCVVGMSGCLLGGNDNTVCHCGVEIDPSRLGPIKSGIYFKLPKIDTNKACTFDNIKFPNSVVNHPVCDPKEEDDATDDE